MIALIPIIVFLGCIVAGSSFQQNLVLDGVSLPVDFTASLGYFPALSVESNSLLGQLHFPYAERCWEEKD
jgi:hypothetical protein